MSKTENAVLEFLRKYILFIAGAVLLFLSFWARRSVLSYLSGDMEMYLIPWFYQIFGNDGLSSLGTGVGNYNIPYQTLIAILTYLRGRPENLIKYLSIIFDYVLAYASMRLVMVSLPKEDKRRGIASFVTFFAVLYLPTVFLNSAVWGQCDALYSSFIVLGILELKKEKPWAAMIFFGLAISFKLQAIFFLPALLLYYFCSRKFSILWLFEIPGMMIVTSLPGLILGRSVRDIFAIYAEQTVTYPYTQMDYPNIYFFLPNDYKLLSAAGIIFALAVLLITYTAVIRNTGSDSLPTAFWLRLTAWTGYACVMLLPAMHERYGFAAEILFVINAVLYRDMILETALLIGITVAAYTTFLFDFTSINLTVLSVINTALFAFVTWKVFSRTGAEPAKAVSPAEEE